MSYKISIKADGDFFTVGCCEFEHFEDAKAQVGKMIVDLMTSHLEQDFLGRWEEFKGEFPKEVLSIIESFENDGVASAANEAEGYTDGYYYLISGNSLLNSSQRPQKSCSTWLVIKSTIIFPTCALASSKCSNSQQPTVKKSPAVLIEIL